MSLKYYILLALIVLLVSACQSAPGPAPAETSPAASGSATIDTPASPPPSTSEPVNAGSHGDSYSPAVSLHGGFVVFVSRGGDLTKLDQPTTPASCPSMAGSQINCSQVYWYERSSRTVRLVSISPEGQLGNGNSGFPDVSADGRYVVFASTATNLSAEKTGSDWGIFLHDTQTGLTELISPEGITPALSSDGRFVAYAELQTNWEVVVIDRETKNKVVASLGNANSSRSTGDSLNPVLSADGRWLAFWSWDGTLVPTDNLVCGPEDGRYNCGDVFLYNGANAEMRMVVVGKGYGLGMGPLPPLSLSGEGRLVAYEDSLYDRIQRLPQPLCGRGGPQCDGGILSANGGWVAYRSPGGIFLYDRSNAESRQLNLSPNGQPGDGIFVDYQTASEGESFVPGIDISTDGRVVVFATTDGNLDPADTAQCSDALFAGHNCYDIYLFDRDSGALEWISK